MPAIRLTLVLTVATALLAATPALGACSRYCDDPYDTGSVADHDHPSGPEQKVAHQHGHAPPIEMSLPGYLWSKFRAEAREAADRTAYALITAGSRLAVVAAREKKELDAADPHAAPKPAPAQAPGTSESECTRRPRA